MTHTNDSDPKYVGPRARAKLEQRARAKGLSLEEFADVDDERTRDLYMLREALRALDQSGFQSSQTDIETDAFKDMLSKLESHREGSQYWRVLTSPQREWVEKVCRRECIDTTPPELRKPVPRGREVPLAPVLKNLPKSPPTTVRRSKS